MLPLSRQNFSFRIIRMDTYYILWDTVTKKVRCQMSLGAINMFLLLKRYRNPRNQWCWQPLHIETVVNVFIFMNPALIYASWASCRISYALILQNVCSQFVDSVVINVGKWLSKQFLPMSDHIWTSDTSTSLSHVMLLFTISGLPFLKSPIWFRSFNYKNLIIDSHSTASIITP